ncbi:MAG: ParA family protein [Dehalobacter sp. 4CP]|uniref:Sporulation initiation inhibitor protein Soj n=2 Tax=Dehalobacter restrictus TaxID=55583 RepID=A0A857DKJ2_9FIRM|nr:MULTISPECIES: ParA family protein [Dehalobacter]NBJ15781.1 ParA family protein [Dehalobacter sp. 4CP]AFV03999.1 Chromosome (plasmid) partitioning protein ParA / Sporulation initiation inhibitor protein Soj [Dehalobacter sp. DCA]AFV06979.1 Chromosome (plasmid) partitioning protein ParA / Sporulation initiation inhibitor protein Soj [Dehalobacter sp. CF]AHF11173.1 sporulation initiation inhibitor Soj [Dehalobacter restrictus DSM 9455]EQB22483.1 Chromosome (plasmid) partitioning protein ParA [
MARIIAIANQKGGVAKTTTAVNLSSSLVEKGKKVLLVDLDPQGNATSGCGIMKHRLSRCIYDVIINEENIQSVIADTELKNLKVAPARIELAGAEIELVSQLYREGKLATALQGIKDEFDFIIIDCPPSLGLLTLNALCAATDVLIPIQCEYYALEGLSLLVNTLDKVKRSINRDLQVIGVLLTMFDARTNLSIQVVDEVKKYFRDKVFRTIIPRNVRLSEAPSHGQPIILYDSKSRGAEVYRDLAEEVLERV